MTCRQLLQSTFIHVCILHSLCSVKTFLFTLPHVLSSAEQLQNNLINNIKRVAEDEGILCCAWKYAMEYCEISAGHVALWFIFSKCFITLIHSSLLSCLSVRNWQRQYAVYIAHVYDGTHTHNGLIQSVIARGNYQLRLAPNQITMP